MSVPQTWQGSMPSRMGSSAMAGMGAGMPAGAGGSSSRRWRWHADDADADGWRGGRRRLVNADGPRRCQSACAAEPAQRGATGGRRIGVQNRLN